MKSKNLTLAITIEKPAREVYGFVSNLANFPKWATTFVLSIQPEGDHWIAQTPRGPIQIKIAPRNDYGVVDHWVMAPGVEVYVPMRIVPSGERACELLFTLFRGKKTEAEFREDVQLVEQDLQTLKTFLERNKIKKDC